MTRPRLHELLLLAASLSVALLAAEAVLRLLDPVSVGYYVLVPGTERTFHPDPERMPGVSGPARYRVNEDGIRGPSFGDDGSEYRILAVGGSTTECAYLDTGEVWTTLLGEQITRAGEDLPVWVGNVGRSGRTTRDHAVQVEYLLQQYPPIDMVLALVGANDVMVALAAGDDYVRPRPITDPEAQVSRMSRAFESVPGRVRLPEAHAERPAATPWYRTTRLWELGRRAKLALDAWTSRALQDSGGRFYQRWREARRRGRRIGEVPPTLREALAEYRSNLEAMVEAAEGRGARTVFVTQPALWRTDNTPAEKASMWMGGRGEFPDRPVDAYYTTAVLRAVMDAFNDELLSVCEERDLLCVDAAARIPRSSSMFYDDVHLTEAGSERLAREIGKALVESGAFEYAGPG